jgi:hypothetical protein
MWAQQMAQYTASRPHNSTLPRGFEAAVSAANCTMHGCTISQKLNLFHPTHGLAHALHMITDICLAAWQINAGLSQPTVWRWI